MPPASPRAPALPRAPTKQATGDPHPQATVQACAKANLIADVLAARLGLANSRIADPLAAMDAASHRKEACVAGNVNTTSADIARHTIHTYPSCVEPHLDLAIHAVAGFVSRAGSALGLTRGLSPLSLPS